jgi:hypothetical protein
LCSVFNDFQIGFNESERISYYCSLKAPLARADQNLPTIVVRPNPRCPTPTDS